MVFKMKTGFDRPTVLMSTLEMVDSVNVLILVNRRVTIEEISEKLGISVSITQKIVHDDLTFSKVNCLWVSLGHSLQSLLLQLELWKPLVTSALQSRSPHL